MEQERVAEYQPLNERLPPLRKVTVPTGKHLAETVTLPPLLSEILGKLKGCVPCNSGVPMWFQNEAIEQIVKVDLERFQRL